MTLHLKDRVIEQKLNELSNGEFSKILNESDMKNPNCICFTIDKKEDIELSVYLRPEAIEPEYDPHNWNEYPKVKPVEPGIYRLEVKRNAGGVTRCYAAVFDFSTGKNWYIYGQGNLINTDVLDGGYVRFRPWEG